MTDPYKAIESELRYLEDKDLGRENLSDTIVALHVATEMAMAAYTTTGVDVCLPWFRHIGGLTKYYFDKSNFDTRPAPAAPLGCVGEWLLFLTRTVQRTEESISRNAVGDTKSHLMTVLSVVVGCMT